MDAGQDLDPAAGIHLRYKRCSEVEAEVRLAAGDQLSLDLSCFGDDVVNVVEPFRAQQVLGDILGCYADTRDLDEADSGRLGRRLVGVGRSPVDKAGHTDRRGRSDEVASALHRSHWALSRAPPAPQCSSM